MGGPLACAWPRRVLGAITSVRVLWIVDVVPVPIGWLSRDMRDTLHVDAGVSAAVQMLAGCAVFSHAIARMMMRERGRERGGLARPDHFYLLDGTKQLARCALEVESRVNGLEYVTHTRTVKRTVHRPAETTVLSTDMAVSCECRV